MPPLAMCSASVYSRCLRPPPPPTPPPHTAGVPERADSSSARAARGAAGGRRGRADVPHLPRDGQRPARRRAPLLAVPLPRLGALRTRGVPQPLARPLRKPSLLLPVRRLPLPVPHPAHLLGCPLPGLHARALLARAPRAGRPRRAARQSYRVQEVATAAACAAAALLLGLSARFTAAEQHPPPPPPSRANWTRLVPPPVLTGRVSSLLPY
jgi:hypothetical protein